MQPLDLNDLVMTHVIAANRADGYATSTHSGLARVLQHLASHGRALAADGGDLQGFAALLEATAAPH